MFKLDNSQNPGVRTPGEYPYNVSREIYSGKEPNNGTWKTNEGNGEILGNKFMEWCCIIMFEALEDNQGYTQNKRKKKHYGICVV